jgi:hypothetical protein
VKSLFWVVFLLIGLIILVSSLQNIIFLPLVTPEGRLDWLTSDPEVLDYVAMHFRILGVWQLALGLLVLAIAVTGLRQRQLWAWTVMWIVPVLLLGVTLVMPWLVPFTPALLILAAGTLLLSRSEFALS